MAENELDLRLAVLIDADNASRTAMKDVMAEVAVYGTPTIKRIYGDWTSPNMSTWKSILLECALTPIQQYGYTTGKNSTDSAMIIDAMDILYSGKVNGFCLVTSDSDFTKLVLRLRESGMTVIGMGERKTPNAFVSACETFKFLDILLNDENPSQNPSLPQTRKESEADGSRKEAEKESDPNAVSNIPNMEEMEKEIISIINTHADDDGWVDLSELGDNLPKRVPGFDPRNYKCTKLKQFIELFDSVEVRSARNPHNKILSIIYVRVKQKEEKPVLSKVRRGGKRKKDADAEE